VEVYIVIFMAAMTQSLTGFGSALVAMALLPHHIGLRASASLVSLIALSIEIVLLLRYRQAVSLREVKPLVAASFVGILIGIYLLRRIDGSVMLVLLGLVIAIYGIYALLDWKLPELRQPAWAYAAGLLAGMLGGAYNTSGPPVILYADCRRWPPSEFKGNLQGFFLTNSVFVVTAHLLSKDLTPDIWRTYLIALPFIALGILTGTLLDRALPPEAFRKIVLLALVVMGIRVVLTA